LAAFHFRDAYLTSIIFPDIFNKLEWSRQSGTKPMFPPKLKSYFINYFLLVLLLSSSLFPFVNQSLADTSSPKITVKAVVSPRLHLKVLYQLPEITIAKPDIQRGFMELPSASRLEVESNNPGGYLLAFQGSLGPFKEVHIKGLDNPVQLESGNAFILQPYTRNSSITIELSYKGILNDKVTPGTYSWPFSISAQPIEYQDHKIRKK
jgi:hypothetical protein